MEIYENNTGHLDAFIQLNEAWISKYFELETSDFELASNPSVIIENGGYIFSLVDNNHIVVGVCALFNKGNGAFELARMAVTESHQGKGYGKALVLRSIEKAKELGTKRLYLLSNTKLERAIALYEQCGFQRTKYGPHPVYSRVDIEMQYEIITQR